MEVLLHALVCPDMQADDEDVDLDLFRLHGVRDIFASLQRPVIEGQVNMLDGFLYCRTVTGVPGTLGIRFVSGKRAEGTQDKDENVE